MDDVRRLAEEKLDLSVFKSAVQQRVSYAEFESYKQVIDRVQHECQNKASLREIESVNDYIKQQFD